MKIRLQSYSSLVERLNTFAVITDEDSPILNSQQPGACIQKVILIHESAKNNAHVWYHELGHVVVKTISNTLNAAERDAFAYSYQYIPEMVDSSNSSANIVTSCLSQGLKDYKTRKKQHSEFHPDETINAGKISKVLKSVLYKNLVPVNTIPVTDGIYIVDSKNNQRTDKIHIRLGNTDKMGDVNG